jgi:hypothetical protein
MECVRTKAGPWQKGTWNMVVSPAHGTDGNMS